MNFTKKLTCYCFTWNDTNSRTMDRFYSKFTIKNAELTPMVRRCRASFFGGDYFRVPMYTDKRLEIELYNSFIMEVIKQNGGSYQTSQELISEIGLVTPCDALRKVKCNTTRTLQKQSSGGVFEEICSENMQQIYRRTPMLKCDFNNVAKHGKNIRFK